MTEDNRFYWLERGAFLLAIALVICRCLSSEFLRDPAQAMPHASGMPLGPGAAVSIVLDLLICIPAILVLWRHSLVKIRRRAGVASYLFLALAIWAAVSVIWAPDRFAAAVGAAHLIAAGALIWTFSQIVHDSSAASAIGAVCIGLLLCYIAYGVIYESLDLPDLRAQWTNNVNGLRTQTLREHGWTEGSFAAKQFAMKILHGQITGFSTSPNTYAAMLVLLGIVSAGVVISNFQAKQNIPLNAALALMIVPVAWLIWRTQSKAAYATPILAIVCFLLIGIFPRVIHRLRRWIYAGIIAAFIIASIVLVQYGIAHGNLHNDSMNFRWKYWVASAKLFEEQPVLGIGWNNFGDRYLAVRLPSAPEEIKDPHDMFVHMFVELGAVGGILFIAFLAAAWWRMTVRDSRSLLDPDPRIKSSVGQMNITAAGLMSAMLMGIVINALATIDFSQIQAFVFLEIIRRCIYLALLLIAMAFIPRMLLSTASNRRSTEPPAGGAPATLLSIPWLLPAICIGLGMFLLHNLIDFSLFDPSPGPMMLFATLIGTVIGIRSGKTKPPRLAWASSGIASALFLAAAFGFVLPVARASAMVHQADTLVRANQPERAESLYRQAVDLVPYNYDYWQRLARAMAFAGASPDQINKAIDRAEKANPYAVSVRLLRARYLRQTPHPPANRIDAAYEAALRLDPCNVSERLEYADFLDQSGNHSQATEQYAKALWYNDQLSPTEPKRLSEQRVSQIKQLIAQLRAPSVR